MAYGKKIQDIYKKASVKQEYSLAEAIQFLKENAPAKFDETFEVSMNVAVDTRKADQNLRGVVSLPHGTGKTLRVAAFVPEDKIEEARKAGADVVGGEDLVEKIENGFSEFDRCVATPSMMAHVGKLGKILGPRGLMPNPKLGTVTMNVAQAIEAIKKGQVEYRAEKNGIVQAGVGKVSFSIENLEENIQTFVQTVVKAKPASVKGTFLKHITLSTTMGGGLKVRLGDFSAA